MLKPNVRGSCEPAHLQRVQCPMLLCARRGYEQSVMRSTTHCGHIVSLISTNPSSLPQSPKYELPAFRDSDTGQGEILYVRLRLFSTNELTASENLDGFFTFFSEAPSVEAVSMMAFSLAVRKGLSLGSAVIWVVTPMRSLGVSEGGRSRMFCCCARSRRLCDLTIMNAMPATMRDNTPVNSLVTIRSDEAEDDLPRTTKTISRVRMVGCRPLPP